MNAAAEGLPKVGDSLPEVSIDITARLIVAGAIASRDYQDVHHDKTAAQALGSPDIFMNILTTNGLVGRYVTDWAGQGARLTDVSIKLGVPNFPGDTMVFSGEVTAVDEADATVVVGIVGKNKLGNHVTGTVTVALPR
jgi:acyl dehydratase